MTLPPREAGVFQLCAAQAAENRATHPGSGKRKNGTAGWFATLVAACDNGGCHRAGAEPCSRSCCCSARNAPNYDSLLSRYATQPCPLGNIIEWNYK